MRVLLTVAAFLAACSQPAPVTGADPVAARPDIRGNRLIAPGGDAAPLEVTLSGPVAAGGTASAIARAAPGSRCRIRVGYMSGPSEAQGLEARIAGDDGAVEWTWVVGIATTPGEWPVEIDCAARDGTRAAGLGRLTVTPRE